MQVLVWYWAELGTRGPSLTAQEGVVLAAMGPCASLAPATPAEQTQWGQQHHGAAALVAPHRPHTAAAAAGAGQD